MFAMVYSKRIRLNLPISAFYPHFSVLSPFQRFIPISAFYPHFSVLSPFQRFIPISAFYPHFSFRFQFPFPRFSFSVLSLPLNIYIFSLCPYQRLDTIKMCHSTYFPNACVSVIFTYWQNGGETDGVGFYYLETDGVEFVTYWQNGGYKKNLGHNFRRVTHLYSI